MLHGKICFLGNRYTGLPCSEVKNASLLRTPAVVGIVERSLQVFGLVTNTSNDQDAQLEGTTTQDLWSGVDNDLTQCRM